MTRKRIGGSCHLSVTRVIAIVVSAVLLFAACSGADVRDAADSSATATATATAPETGVFGRIPSIVDDVEPVVVAVLTDNGEGSGVVYRADGIVVTNHHVIASADRVTVAFADGRRTPAHVLASDELTDVAVLRVDRRSLPVARFASELPMVGELAVAIGDPLGFDNSATAGIVSGLHRSIPGSTAQSLALVDLIQTDAPISPGNSGGALVGDDGRVLGLNVAFIPPQANAVSIGFAIPAATVVRVADELLADGRATHVFFGIRPGSVTKQIADRLGLPTADGVLVLAVVPDGPADHARIRGGDLITRIGGTRVPTVEAFLGELRRHRAGDDVRVTVLRNDREEVLSARLSTRPP